MSTATNWADYESGHLWYPFVAGDESGWLSVWPSANWSATAVYDVMQRGREIKHKKWAHEKVWPNIYQTTLSLKLTTLYEWLNGLIYVLLWRTGVASTHPGHVQMVELVWPNHVVYCQCQYPATAWLYSRLVPCVTAVRAQTPARKDRIKQYNTTWCPIDNVAKLRVKHTSGIFTTLYLAHDTNKEEQVSPKTPRVCANS